MTVEGCVGLYRCGESRSGRAIIGILPTNSGRDDDALWGVESPHNDSVSKVPHSVSPPTRQYDSQMAIDPSTTHTSSPTSLRTGTVCSLEPPTLLPSSQTMEIEFNCHER